MTRYHTTFLLRQPVHLPLYRLKARRHNSLYCSSTLDWATPITIDLRLDSNVGVFLNHQLPTGLSSLIRYDASCMGTRFPSSSSGFKFSIPPSGSVLYSHGCFCGSSRDNAVSSLDSWCPISIHLTPARGACQSPRQEWPRTWRMLVSESVSDENWRKGHARTGGDRADVEYIHTSYQRPRKHLYFSARNRSPSM